MSKLTAYDKFIQQALKYGFSLFGLPKTGQTISYVTGDDGTYQKGYPATGAKFTDNGDGTITDNATGLMWAKDGNGAGCNNGNGVAWPAALTWAGGLNFAGHSDWRLPNVKELMSIVDHDESAPAVDTTFFPNTQSNYYWSSTTFADYTGNAWFVYFYNGYVNNVNKDITYYVRAVRGGQRQETGCKLQVASVKHGA